MALTDEQLMLLEQLTYMNDDVLRAAGIEKEDFVLEATSVEEIVDQFKDTNMDKLCEPDLTNCGIYPEIKDENGNGTHITGPEWAAVINAIKDDPELMSMKIEHTTFAKDDLAGYNVDAMTFVPPKSKGDAVVCFRGTLNGEEWKDDSEYFGAIETDCNQKALMYINQLPYSNITVVGHSKGANKAAYVYFESDKVAYCLAMDCPGVSPEFYASRADIINSKKGTINCYSLTDDFVNILLMPVPNANYIYVEGSGVANFAENHCPNCFFQQKVNTADPGQITLKGIKISKEGQSETMKTLNGFTRFLAMEMPYGQRVEMSSYIGDILDTALKKCDFKNKPEESEAMIRKVVFSDDTKLAQTAAYLIKYCDLYGLSSKDIEKLLKENGIDFKFDRTVLYLLFNNIKDGKDDPIVSKAFAKYLESKGILDYESALKLYKKIEKEYGKLDDITKKPELSFEYYENRLYNYTSAAHEAFMTAISEFQEIHYDTTTIWDAYVGEEWYDIVSANLVRTSLNQYYARLPGLNNACKNAIEIAFQNEWAIDTKYADKLSEYGTSLEKFAKKVEALRDRLAVN